jgi:hypothetical protein
MALQLLLGREQGDVLANTIVSRLHERSQQGCSGNTIGS